MAATRNLALGILIISDDANFIEDTSGTFLNLSGVGRLSVSLDQEHKSLEQNRARSVPANPVYEHALQVAGTFLASHPGSELVVFQTNTFEAALARIAEKKKVLDFSVGMVILDETTVGDLSYERSGLIQTFDNFYTSLSNLGVPWIRSSYSIVAYTAGFPFMQAGAYLPPLRYLFRVKPADTSLLRADLLCCFMDFFELTFLNRRAQRTEKNRENVTLAASLTQFLNNRSGERKWDCYYYTGSVVSSLIETIEKTLYLQNQFCFMGPNEHSLACGAMANWKLYQRPFLIVITSAMGDEFKGTLANLRESRARGFIVIAENREDTWFPFQGTHTAEEDMQHVMTARRLPSLFLEDPDRLTVDLSEAFRLYEKGEGPVVLFVTQQVLQSRQALTLPIENLFPPKPERASLSIQADNDARLRRILDVLNNHHAKIIWQAGHLENDEYELMIQVAEKSGLALCDNLTRPGNVSKYRNGKLVKNYLGTLSLYGFSQRAYRYMHTDGKLNPKESQLLFFFKSKISQINSPFSESAMKNKLRIGQLTSSPGHVAYFADYPCVMDSREFLKRLSAGLEVRPEVLAYRNKGLEELPFTTGDVVSKVATQPLHPNYFFRRLNQVVEDLIVNHGYDYTGVYDVGRNGVSGYRNVARTRQGFSGWYGRALMGDALLSINTLAVSSPTNLIAFIGDGARNVVPDIRASMVENITHMCRPGEFQKNVTVFYMINGLVALINTYQERMMSHRARRQMRCVSLLDSEIKTKVGDLVIQQKILYDFDEDLVRGSLLAPGQLNFFSVVTNHNNTGDGMSLLTVDNWQEL